VKEHPTKLKEMKKQCESQNTNPNHSRQSRDTSQRSDNQTGSTNRHSTSIKSDQTGSDQIGRQKRTGSEREHQMGNTQYKRIKTEKQDNSNSIHYAHESKPNHPVLPPVKMPGQSKAAPVVKTQQQHDRDHRRSAPGHIQQSSINTRKDAIKILNNRAEGDSILKYLSQDFNFLKECLKNKEI
jgi:hypothetical protein